VVVLTITIFWGDKGRQLRFGGPNCLCFQGRWEIFTLHLIPTFCDTWRHFQGNFKLVSRSLMYWTYTDISALPRSQIHII